MPKKRNYYRYELRDKGKIVYIGISDDPTRRGSEHEREGKRFTSMNIKGPTVTKESAINWEDERLKQYQKNHKGRNPRYNKE